jgi:hypothetical protein
MALTPLRRLVSIFCLLIVTAQAHASTVQLDIMRLLNARVVTTVHEGKLVTWPDSLDNAGSGEATQAAADLMDKPGLKALPDDGFFPATKQRPEVRLYAANHRPTGPQVRRSVGADHFEIRVPAVNCRQAWLFFMSGCGDSTLHFTLHYQDGTSEKRDMKAPDWWNAADPKDPTQCDLAVDLGKWDNQNRMMETDHHYIVGLDLRPNPKRVLVRIEVEKDAPAVLTLWGATVVKVP